MVAVAKFGAHRRGRHLAHLDGQIDGNMACFGDIGVATRADELLVRHAVLLFDDGLNRLDVDLFGRCVEVLAGDGVDIVKGELPALALAVARLAGAALAKALEFADVGARDLGHVFKVVVGQVPAVAPIGRQQRVVACLGSGDDGVLVIALQDLVFHLVAGLCDQAEHAGVEAAGQTLVHAQVLGGAVCRDDDLLVVADELVHELEKVVHARALADDVLDVIDDEHVHAVVCLHDRGVALLLAVELGHQVVQICLGVGILDLDLGRLLGELVFDGKQQVRLAQARFAVDEQ